MCNEEYKRQWTILTPEKYNKDTIIGNIIVPVIQIL